MAKFYSYIMKCNNMNCTFVTRCQSICEKKNINLLKYVFIDKYGRVWNSHKHHLAGTDRIIDTVRLLIDNLFVTNKVILNNLPKVF